MCKGNLAVGFTVIHVFTMFRLETVRNELILQGLNYLSGAFLSSPKRGAVRSAELGCFLPVDPWFYVQHKTALTLSSEQFLWGEPYLGF